MNVSLAILGGFLALAFALGIAARRGRKMTMEQWAVGGRGFGTLLVFLLLAGEIYTTFTFLGGSGWSYGRGAPAFYIICYGALGYTMSYFLAPVIWRYGARHGLHSQTDYFVRRYGSRALGVIVAIVGVVAIVPYLVLQLKGLGIIVSETSYGQVSQPLAIGLSVAVLVVYVVVSGVHGSAWTAVVKDIMILGVAVGLGIYLPIHYYGGLRPMFEAIDAAKPGFLLLPAKGLSPTWFVSTVLLSGLGWCMWPHGFASYYTASSGEVLRKNAVVLPLYQLVMLFIFFCGFAAVLQVPGLKGADADLSLLRLARQTFPPALVGVIGAAGVLTALVPGSMLLLTSATLIAKNLVPIAVPSVGERSQAWVARACVPLIALVAAGFALRGGSGIVPLLLLGYSLVTQLFPAFILSLPERPLATPIGAIAGLLVGEATVAWFGLSGRTLALVLPRWPAAVTDLNPGLIALVANTLIVLAVSAATRRSASTLASAATAGRPAAAVSP